MLVSRVKMSALFNCRRCWIFLVAKCRLIKQDFHQRTQLQICVWLADISLALIYQLPKLEEGWKQGINSPLSGEIGIRGSQWQCSCLLWKHQSCNKRLEKQCSCARNIWKRQLLLSAPFVWLSRVRDSAEVQPEMLNTFPPQVGLFVRKTKCAIDLKAQICF